MNSLKVGAIDRRSLARRLQEVSVGILGEWLSGNTRMLISKGDVTRWPIQPLRRDYQGGGISAEEEMVALLRVAELEDVKPFGPTSPSGLLDAGVDVESMDLPETLKRRARREQEDYLYRLLHLDHEESVCVVQAPSGLGPARPIRGSLTRRGGGGVPTIAYDQAITILYSRDSSEQELTAAIFAFLVSSASNFFYTFDSTNEYVGVNEIKQLPFPGLNEKNLQRLKRLGGKIQAVGEEFWNRKWQFECDEDLHDIKPSPASIIRQAPIATESLQEAVMMDHLSLPTRASCSVASLVNQGKVEVTKGGRYRKLVEERLRKVEVPYDDCLGRVMLPIPKDAQTCQEYYEEVQQTLADSRDELYKTLAELDQYVLRLYGIDEPGVIRLIGRGMPWANSNCDWVEGVQKHYLGFERIEQRGEE